MPPVYPPFWEYVREAGGTVTEVPLRAPDGDPDPFDTTAGWRIDLDGIARASPTVPARSCSATRTTRSAWCTHGTTSSRSHGWPPSGTRSSCPTRSTRRSPTPTRRLHPVPDVRPEAVEHGVALTSASKAWNLAGTSARSWSAHRNGHVPGSTGCRSRSSSGPGSSATPRASPRSGTANRGSRRCSRELATNRRVLAEELGAALPGAGYRQPQASYLAWIDLRALPWGATGRRGPARAGGGGAVRRAGLRAPGRRPRPAQLRLLRGDAARGPRGLASPLSAAC